MLTDLPLIQRARLHSSAVAFRTSNDMQTYAYLLDQSHSIARQLLSDTADLQERRVAVLIPTGAEYTAAQWGIWRAGGIMLPLCLSATEPEWEYSLTDSQVSVLLTTQGLAPKLQPLCERLSVKLLVIDNIETQAESPNSVARLPNIDRGRRAMILYTSGTTSKPKGVVTTHVNIQAQIESLVTAWEWQASDCIPLFLPLHHIHGIINIMSCALWSGACIEPFDRFDLPAILDRVRARTYSLFMAVPTIYVKLIEALRSLSEEQREQTIAGFQHMRLMVSGSAALPATVHEEWSSLVGHRLLERYGMTEIGMALSNAYRGERRPGSVGMPLPGVQVRLKADDGSIVSAEDQPGEIQVRGANVFLEYWNRSKITRDSFDEDWFRTGDMAVVETGYYRIMGRQSVDIIKSGGYKLSALEIESTLLEHPAIRECAVVGIPDDTWGEAVAAVAVLQAGTNLEIEELRDWCRARLSVYKIPKRLLTVPELPRNAMGKVTKPAVSTLLMRRSEASNAS